jgi:hypothetical protein
LAPPVHQAREESSTGGADLIEAGYVEREKVGRRNRYHLNAELKMRHAAQANLEVGQLLHLLEAPGAGESETRGQHLTST